VATVQPVKNAKEGEGEGVGVGAAVGEVDAVGVALGEAV